MVKLTGGRWPAKAAAAVTQLPFGVYDRQRRVGGTVAVRGAQRHRRDVTAEDREPDGRTGGWVMECQGRGKTMEIVKKKKLVAEM